MMQHTSIMALDVNTHIFLTFAPYDRLNPQGHIPLEYAKGFNILIDQQADYGIFLMLTSLNAPTLEDVYSPT